MWFLRQSQNTNLYYLTDNICQQEVVLSGLLIRSHISIINCLKQESEPKHMEIGSVQKYLKLNYVKILPY